MPSKSSTKESPDDSNSQAITKMLSPQAHVLTMRSLLSAELAAETAESSLLLTYTPPNVLARAGLAILNLCVTSMRTGMGGRTILELSLDSAVIPKGSNGELPEHAIRTGDIARIGPKPSDSAKKKERAESQSQHVEGVVVRVGERSLQVALGKKGSNSGANKGDDMDINIDVPDSKLWLVKLANDVTYRRMDIALRKLLDHLNESYTPLERILLGLDPPNTPDLTTTNNITFFNPHLNASQQDAIKFALAATFLALIHGPPGTGKTYTIIELILQFLRQGLRILVCGPSNISVDNIVERLSLASPDLPIVRLGHPARLLPSVLNHSLEVLSKTSDAAGLVNDIRDEIDEKLKSIKKTRSGRERKQIYQDVRELRKDFREREGKAVDELIRTSPVILATLHGAGGKQTKNHDFDVLIIDEAGQAVEPQCWVPILMAGKGIKKVILAGDHLQLPPTIRGEENGDKQERRKRIADLESELKKLSFTETDIHTAKEWSLETTLFERLMQAHGAKIGRMLQVQYRMHEQIMSFPSHELYAGRLTADASVKSILLSDLPGVQETDDTTVPLIFYDTQGGEFEEKTEEEVVNGKVSKSILLGDSKSNEAEAYVVRMHVRKLIAAGVKGEDIAVITPYNAQLSILSSLLREEYPGIELGSVDGFQGREKEVVIVSLVRSNGERQVGFLAEKRRLNVAMTRPKRQLVVVGDSETVGKGGEFLKRWMAWLEDMADLRYPDLNEVME